MSTQPYRPCPSCGGVEFDSLPDLGFDLYNAKKATKLQGCQMLVLSLVVCSGCGKTDVYTRNAARVVNALPGIAAHFRATPKPG